MVRPNILRPIISSLSKIPLRYVMIKNTPRISKYFHGIKRFSNSQAKLEEIIFEPDDSEELINLVMNSKEPCILQCYAQYVIQLLYF